MAIAFFGGDVMREPEHPVPEAAGPVAVVGDDPSAGRDVGVMGKPRSTEFAVASIRPRTLDSASSQTGVSLRRSMVLMQAPHVRYPLE
jgi:hypothetical protein